MVPVVDDAQIHTVDGGLQRERTLPPGTDGLAERTRPGRERILVGGAPRSGGEDAGERRRRRRRGGDVEQLCEHVVAGATVEPSGGLDGYPAGARHDHVAGEARFRIGPPPVRRVGAQAGEDVVEVGPVVRVRGCECDVEVGRWGDHFLDQTRRRSASVGEPELDDPDGIQAEEARRTRYVGRRDGHLDRRRR